MKAIERVTADKLKAEKDRNVLRVQKSLVDRQALEAELKVNSERLDALRSDAAEPALLIPGMTQAEMDKLDKQNAAMEQLIANLRENVALLEYKITTLQRYKDRNKAAPVK